MANVAKLSKQQKSTQATQDEQSRLAASCRSFPVVGHKDMPFRTHSSTTEREHTERRGRKHKSRSTGSASSRSSMVTSMQQHQSSSLWSWRAHLPQSADDRAVKDKTHQVFAFADQYVSNYYRNLPFLRMKHSQVFSSLELPLMPHSLPLEEALYRFNNPKAIIKHCLVRALVHMISFDASGPFSSLLPAEFTTIAKSRRMTTSAMDVPDSHAAFSAYRVLSSYLRPDVLSGNDSFQSTRQQVIADTFEVFGVFDPWLDTDKSQDRREKAWVNLMVRTSELGIFLYSQASTFWFQWKVESSAEDTVRIPISPHLLKIYDEDAQELESAQLMLNLKSEEAWDVRSPLNMNPYEVGKSHAGDEEALIYQLPHMDPHTVPPNSVRRKAVATHANTVSELDGRGAVQRRSSTKSSVPPSLAWLSLSELPADSRQAVELDTQQSRSRRDSLDPIAKQITQQCWQQATDPPSQSAAVNGHTQQRQDRHSARHTPPSSYPSKRPNPTMTNSSSVNTTEGPEVPNRQSLTASTMRRSLSISARPAQPSDPGPPEISQDSNQVLNDEESRGLGPGHGGSSEIIRFGSLKDRKPHPQSHSDYFKEITSKSKEPHKRPLPLTPSEKPRAFKQTLRQPSGLSGIEAENMQKSPPVPDDGQGNVSKKKIKWWKSRTSPRIDEMRAKDTNINSTA